MADFVPSPTALDQLIESCQMDGWYVDRDIALAALRDRTQFNVIALTTAEWIRRRLREGNATTQNTATKLAAIDGAYRHSAPAPDIDQLLDEIERGYVARTNSI